MAEHREPPKVMTSQQTPAVPYMYTQKWQLVAPAVSARDLQPRTLASLGVGVVCAALTGSTIRPACISTEISKIGTHQNFLWVFPGGGHRHASSLSPNSS